MACLHLIYMYGDLAAKLGPFGGRNSSPKV